MTYTVGNIVVFQRSGYKYSEVGEINKTETGTYYITPIDGNKPETALFKIVRPAFDIEVEIAIINKLRKELI